MSKELENTIREVRKSLRSFGMPRSTSTGLVGDLRADLEAAEAEGLGPPGIVGDDPRDFARQLAAAHGYEPTPQRMIGLSLAAFLPMTVIAFIVYVIIAGGGENLGLPRLTVAIRTTGDRPVLEGVNEGWFVLATYAVAGLLGVGLTLASAAAYLSLRKDTCVGRTLVNMLIALPVGGALGIGGAMFYGALRDYPVDALNILVECLIVAIGVISSLWAARRLARRTPPGGGNPLAVFGR